MTLEDLESAADEFRLEERRAHEAALDQHERLMGLAAHNGYEIEFSIYSCYGFRIWLVPPAFVPIVGYQAALVR